MKCTSVLYLTIISCNNILSNTIIVNFGTDRLCKNNLKIEII